MGRLIMKKFKYKIDSGIIGGIIFAILFFSFVSWYGSKTDKMYDEYINMTNEERNEYYQKVLEEHPEWSNYIE